VSWCEGMDNADEHSPAGAMIKRRRALSHAAYSGPMSPVATSTGSSAPGSRTGPIHCGKLNLIGVILLKGRPELRSEEVVAAPVKRLKCNLGHWRGTAQVAMRARSGNDRSWLYGWAKSPRLLLSSLSLMRSAGELKCEGGGEQDECWNIR
jgi:hypothetical protein